MKIILLFALLAFLRGQSLAAEPVIEVGPNIRISTRSGVPHVETTVSAHPTDTSRVVVVSANVFHRDPRGQPTNVRVNGDDDLSWLCPEFVPEFNVFVCPGTRNNNVRTNLLLDPWSGKKVIRDLADHAIGGSTGVNGHSY